MPSKDCLNFFNFMVLLFYGVNVIPMATAIREERSRCGGNINSESGVIQSPNYPNNYGRYEGCTWVITVPEDNRIELEFQDFNLEPQSNCDFDVLRVYDGSSTSSHLLSSLCGPDKPPPMQSSGNTITLEFRTDHSLSYKGFSSTFTKVPMTTETECFNPRSSRALKWIYHHDYCYSIHVGDTLTFVGGKEFCHRNGAVLTSVHSSEEMNFIQQMVRPYSSRSWIGLRKQTPYGYKWVDGTPVDYLNWSFEDGTDDEDDIEGSGSDFSYHEIATCASFEPSGSSWGKGSCDNRYHAICKYKNESEVSATLTTVPPTTLSGFCPHDWYTFGNLCYKVMGTTSQPWRQANEQCRTMNSSLVSIHSREEQNFIGDHLIGESGHSFWIGLSRPSAWEAFKWEDNSPLDFSNWARYQPSAYERSKPKDCVFMDKDYPSTGNWKSNICDHVLPYICQRTRDSTISTPGIDPSACPLREDWLKIRTSCYKSFWGNFSSSPWLEAQSRCESQQANLATVLNLETTVELSSHLEELEGYFWIGIITSSKHKYTWIGGAPLIYSNWQTDQPREVSEESNCVAINTEGEWMVRECNESLPFICEIGEAPEVPTLPPHPENLTCPDDTPGWHDFGGQYCYIMEIKHRRKWYEAYCECEKRGGFLASFHSTDETNVMLHHLQHFDMFVHIGFEQDTQGRFTWSDGSPIDYDNWASGEPSNSREQCAAMSTTTGKWSGIQCADTFGYICSTLKVPKVEVTTPRSLQHVEEEDQLSPGYIALIVISVLGVLVIVAVVLYYAYPSRKESRSNKVPFARID